MKGKSKDFVLVQFSAVEYGVYSSKHVKFNQDKSHKRCVVKCKSTWFDATFIEESGKFV